MTSTYSSIANNMWPPASTDMTDRLERLQELEKMRKERQMKSGISVYSEPKDANTRLSRRQQISGSIGMNRLSANHEERRKAFLGRRALNEDKEKMSGSQGNLSGAERYGGARPKNLDVAYVSRNFGSESSNNGRNRSSSLTDSEENISASLLRSHSLSGIQTNQNEHDVHVDTSLDNQTFSQSVDSHQHDRRSISEDEEDIESFKQSLLGARTLSNVQEREEITLQHSLPVFSGNVRESNIDTSRLLIHRENPRTDLKFSKSVSSSSKGQPKIKNIVSESMKRVDSLFDTPSTKFDSSVRSPRVTSRSERLELRSNVLSRDSERESQNRSRVTLKGSFSSANEAENSQKLETEVEQSTQQIQSDDGQTVSVTTTSDEVESNRIDNVQAHNETQDASVEVTSESSKGSELESSMTNNQVLSDETLQTVTSVSVSQKLEMENLENDDIEENLEVNNQNDEMSNVPQFIRIPKEEDLVDASNVGYFEMGQTDNSSMFSNIQSEIVDDSADFSQFSNASEFLDYDKSNRDVNDIGRTSTFGLSSEQYTSKFDDIFDNSNQSQNRSKSVDEGSESSYRSRLRTSRKEDEADSSYRSQLRSSRLADNTENSYRSRFRTSRVDEDSESTNDYRSRMRTPYSRQTSDTTSSRLLYGNDNDNVSSYSRTLPYSQRETSDFSTYSNSLPRKSSAGTTGLSRDALSRIDDIFGEQKKENSLLSEIQTSTMPRRRAREMVGSRPTITRSRSDASESGYEGRRTLLGRPFLSNTQAEEADVEVERRQPLFVSSLDKYNQSQSDEGSSITTRFGSLRSRLGIGLNKAKDEDENEDDESHTNSYTRSRSVDHGYQSKLMDSGPLMSRSYELSGGYTSSFGNRDISSEISKLTGEISSEFLETDESENVDSNKTLTPDDLSYDNVPQGQGQEVLSSVQNIAEPLPLENEIILTETVIDEEISFDSSCNVEMGEVLICSQKDMDKNENKKIVETDKDSNINVSKQNEQAKVDTKPKTNVETNSTSEKIETVDDNKSQSSEKDADKASVEENDNKSMTSSASTSSSSKKKKNKKKNRKGQAPDPPKVLVSHPSELLKKNKKSGLFSSKDSLHEQKSDEKTTQKSKKEEKSPKKDTKSKEEKESPSKKSPKDKENSKSKESKSPSKDGSVKSDKSTESTKSTNKSKVKNLFDSLIHVFDHKSDTSSVNLLSDKRSQSSSSDKNSHSSGEKTPTTCTQIDEWEIILDPDMNIISEDNYATFEDEDIIKDEKLANKRPSSDDAGGISTDNYETASDHTLSGGSEYEEFFEALPSELLGHDWQETLSQTETERKEHFVYVCASSRVKRQRSTSIDGKNNENVDQWIENNLYPGKKYPEQGEKVSNKKLAEGLTLSQNELPQSEICEVKTIESAKNVETDLASDNVDNKQNVDNVKDITKQADVSVQMSSADNDMKNNSNEAVLFEKGADVVSNDDVKTVDNSKLSAEMSTNSQKIIQNGHLELKASDSEFTDRLVHALRQRLCFACQGVLIDVLKETYFTRYEEIAKINLSSDDTGTSDCSAHGSMERLNGKAQKSKKSPVKLDDLLYGDSKKSPVQNGASKQMSKTPTSPQKAKLKDKPIFSGRNENFVGSPNGKVSPPKSHEVKVKGKVVSLDGNKRESVPLPRPDGRRKSVETNEFKGSSATRPGREKSRERNGSDYMKETKSSRQKSIERRNSEGKVETRPARPKSLERKSAKNGNSKLQKTNSKQDEEEEEEYKLPHLKDNPFIRTDKMRVSKGKSDSSIKSYTDSTKASLAKRSMSLNLNSSENGKSSPTRSKTPEKNGRSSGTNTPVRHKSPARSKTPERTKSPTPQKPTAEKSVKPVTGNNGTNGASKFDRNSSERRSDRRSKVMSPRGPSMTDNLNLAKLACESIGPNDDIDKTSDAVVQSSDPSELLDGIPKTVKAPPRKKKFSVWGDTDVANDLDLSPEEAHGVSFDEDDEVVPHRINLINWDPTKLLNVLYTVKLNKDTVEDVSHQFVNMEGLMEKLPMNKKKATLLKTWKRRFFRAKDGWLHYYEGLTEEETSNRDRPSDSVQLMGGKIEDLGNRVLGVDDGRGRFLMVRCPTEKEYGQWKLALESQTVNNVKATYVRPALSSPPHPEKKVVIIDIGSGAIRAGIMGAQPCLPQMFFPSIVARNKTTNELVIGIDAYKPEVRKNSTLIKIVEPSNKVDKFAIDMELITAVFDYIFKGLKVDPTKYWIMLSTPYKLGDTAMSNLMQILTDKFHSKGACMVMQSLLALYSYNATSGIIVDVGERMEILPIFDGVLIEGGVSRQAYGGQKVADSLNSSLVALKYKFFTPVDKLLVRYVMEQSCYVCDNYKDLKSKCDKDSESYQTTVYLNNFDLPDDAHMSVTHDLSCFKSPEGFFNTDHWGMDYPCVHKLIHQAIQTCPMDNRKHMYRAIYLSGGVTMLQGFADRLELELKKLAPPNVVVEVHASPQRYHSAFIGAGTLLSNVPINEQIFISAEEWKKDGAKAFRKWKGPS